MGFNRTFEELDRSDGAYFDQLVLEHPFTEDSLIPYIMAHSIKSVTLTQFIKELKSFASDYPDRKVGCREYGTLEQKFLCFNSMDENENGLPAVVLARYDDVGGSDGHGGSYTVSDYLNTDPDDFDKSVKLIVRFRRFNHVCYSPIIKDENGIFFNAKVGDKDVVAFRIGQPFAEF